MNNYVAMGIAIGVIVILLILWWLFFDDGEMTSFARSMKEACCFDRK